MTAVTSTSTDPLSVFLQNARPHDKVPVPLQSTAFDITIEAGLAIVLTTRLFRNAEDKAIEATLTFPVPVHAVLFSLEVRIGERRLKATAHAREAARSTYEEGLDEGKTAILHEELLRGIHMLSVGNIPPGKEIEVKTIWAMPLMMAGGEGHLRIPTTVGQIYGQSPLADGDDFTWGDDVPMADVTVKSPGAPARIGGRTVGTDPVQVRMNRPVDLAVGIWQTSPLRSHTADGAGIELELRPAPETSTALSLAILVDHSGSMEAPVSGGETGQMTVHGLVISALKALSTRMTHEDYVDLWEFSHEARHIGDTSGKEASIATLIRQLSSPDGGTEINASLSAVLGKTQANSVLLITDGRSHALDVHALAARGQRISVLLVGEDSLEAQVGHLAALTGGDIFVAPKNAVDKVLGAALNSLRTAPREDNSAGAVDGEPLEYCVSGMMLRLERKQKGPARDRNALEHAVAALAAHLQLPKIPEKDAARLAAAEGIVTHLTSLALVDEAASVEDAIPLRRRVPLAPADAGPVFSHRSTSFVQASSSAKMARMRNLVDPSDFGSASIRASRRDEDAVLRRKVQSLAFTLDWDKLSAALAQAAMDQLPSEVADLISEIAAVDQIQNLGSRKGVDPVIIAISLLAGIAARQGNRSAIRVQRKLAKSMSAGTMGEIVALTDELSKPSLPARLRNQVLGLLKALRVRR